jgi:nucleoside-diphosphate-sugar epimerase
MARVAIIGGHGQVALRLSRLLTERGHQVTSLFRNPEQTDDVRQTGARPVVLDVEESSADEIARRMGGHDALVWSAGAGGGNPARTYAVDRDAAIRSMDAAGQAGVGRYIMVSYLGAGLQHGVPEDDPFFAYAEAKAAADDYLRKTELDWTILGPGRLTLEEPSGGIAVGPDVEKAGRNTSRGNVALVAVAVMGEPQTIGMKIDFVDGEMPIEKAILKGVGE